MKKIILALLLACLILPFVKADLITPGFTRISISNQVTNINNLPDYVFIASCNNYGAKILKGNDRIVAGCPYQLYLSVYAIEKSKFNETKFNGLFSERVEGIELQREGYFESVSAKEVIKNVRVTKQVPITSTQKSITNYYTIDLSEVKEKPDKVVIERTPLIYVYIILPIIALIIILLIIFLRRK